MAVICHLMYHFLGTGVLAGEEQTFTVMGLPAPPNSAHGVCSCLQLSLNLHSPTERGGESEGTAVTGQNGQPRAYLREAVTCHEEGPCVEQAPNPRCRLWSH